MRQYSQSFWRKFYPLLTAAVLFGVVEMVRQIAMKVPHLVEDWYSQGLSSAPSALLGVMSTAFAFSLAEPLLYAHGLFALLWLAASLWRLLSRQWSELFLGLSRAIAYLLILYSVFMLLWGFHYLRPTLAERIALPVQPRAVSELATLAEALIHEANEQRADLNDDAFKSEASTSKAFDQLSSEMSDTFKTFAAAPVGQQMGLLQGSYSQPKGVIYSEGMSYIGITGIYMPFTGEANVNTHAPWSLLPATMLHELAHQRGVAPEDEANFVAYLASQASADKRVQYSGSLLALIHTVNALQKTAPEEARTLKEQYSDAVLADLQAINAYWKRYEGEASKTQERLNDAYLKHNQQASGVESYGEMVDLLLAYSAQGNK